MLKSIVYCFCEKFNTNLIKEDKNMDYKRVLTIQDISCFGQCSLTVALPILSLCGAETVILPSAVLSTHTAGFTGFTVRDLTDDIPDIARHWEKEGIVFDVIYTGYLGSTKQIGYVKDIFARLSRKDALTVVDPAMADGGRLYPAFDEEYVENMKTLVDGADFVVPNVTEACFLTGIEYREAPYDKEYIASLERALVGLGAKAVVLTGVSYREGFTGVAVYENGSESYYEHKLCPQGSHGTGDIFASAFTGALTCNKSAFESARIAADYTLRCVEETQGDDSHRYGAKFEPQLPYLAKLLGKV